MAVRNARTRSENEPPGRISEGEAAGDPPAEAAAEAWDSMGLAPVALPDAPAERKLVEAAQRGDSSAVEALYRTHYDKIYRYFLLRLGSAETAEELTSQVFLGMVKGLGRYRHGGTTFSAWLYGIAQRQLAHHWRSHKRAPRWVDLDAADGIVAATQSPHASAEEVERRAGLARALRQLPDAQREVVMLRYILSLPHAEIASVMGRSEGAVKQLQARALGSLKEMLEAQSANPF